MSDTGEDFKAFNEFKAEERKRIEPNRFAYAKLLLKDYETVENSDHLIIKLQKSTIAFWPYTGWFQGQKPFGYIKGRGIKNLLKSLKGKF